MRKSTPPPILVVDIRGKLGVRKLRNGKPDMKAVLTHYKKQLDAVRKLAILLKPRSKI